MLYYEALFMDDDIPLKVLVDLMAGEIRWGNRGSQCRYAGVIMSYM